MPAAVHEIECLLGRLLPDVVHKVDAALVPFLAAAKKFSPGSVENCDYLVYALLFVEHRNGNVEFYVALPRPGCFLRESILFTLMNYKFENS